jgi:hypothetical protein
MKILYIIIELYRSMALGTGIGVIGNYVDTLSETLKIYLAASHLITCNISYFHVLGKPSTENSLSALTELKIFDYGRESKFKKAKIQLAKFSQLVNQNRYKINLVCTGISLLEYLSSLMADLLTGKRLKNKDVIKWLPDFKKGNLYTFCRFVFCQ